MIGIAILAGSAYAATQLNQSFMPTVDQGSVNVALTLPPGTALANTDLKAREVETRLLARSDVKSVLATVGGRGAPEDATFTVNLKPGHSLEEFLATARVEHG